MEAAVPAFEAYSAEVRLELQAGGKVFALASVGPDEIVAQNDFDIERSLDCCNAKIVMSVDGKRFSWDVRLPNGVNPLHPVIEMERLGSMQRI